MRFRIVKDDYCGYEVQHRRWWWPWWIQTNGTNTHTSVERASQFIMDQHARMTRGNVVEEFVL